MNVNQAGRAVARPRIDETPEELASCRPRKDASPRPGTAPPADRQAGRIAAAEQSLADAYAYARTMGVDPDIANTAFAVLRDCIAQVKECSEHAQRELSMRSMSGGRHATGG